MPESRRRKKQAYTPPPEGASASGAEQDRRKPVRIGGSRWIAPAMVAMFVIGLAWIVVWYIVPENPVMGSLGGWNVAIGFAFIGVGFVLSTKWE